MKKTKKEVQLDFALKLELCSKPMDPEEEKEIIEMLDNVTEEDLKIVKTEIIEL